MSVHDEDDSMGETKPFSSSSVLSLHDCLSLGEVELGLEASQGLASEEIPRLPWMMRLLSLTRPLAAVSIVETPTTGDPVINRAVERLEHVAATHSVAEGVDVVTCHLAPTMARKLSKVPSLKCNKNGELDTSILMEVARNPKGSSKRKVRSDDNENHLDASPGANEGIASSSSSEDEEDNDDEREDEGYENGQQEPAKKKSRKSFLQRRDSMDVAAEDSQEATVVKTLSELTSLVAISLEPISDHHHHAHDTEEDPLPHAARKGQLAITMDDSILSESGREGLGGAMEGSDLGSTVAAIMHHAPVLLSRHVANALCRAAFPQAGELMTRMGANCPASVSSLLLGCVEAYSLAVEFGHVSIAGVAKKGVKGLAELSPRERSRVQTKLLTSGIMLDVQLSLAMEGDPASAACLIIQHLSKLPGLAFLTVSATKTGEKDSAKDPRAKSEQSSGDAPSDFRGGREMDDEDKPESREPSLPQLLYDSPQLYQETLNFFAGELNVMAKNLKKYPKGRVCLVLKAFSFLFLVPTKKAPKFDLPSHVLKSILPQIRLFLNQLSVTIPCLDSIPKVCDIDQVIQLAQSSLLLSSARTFDDDQALDEATKLWQESLGYLQEFPSVSLHSDGFLHNIKNSIVNNRPFVLFSHILSVLTDVQNSGVPMLKRIYSLVETELTKLLSFGGMDLYVSKDTGDIMSRISNLLLETNQIPEPREGFDCAMLKDTLKSLLDDPVDLLSIIRDPKVGRFVFQSTIFLCRTERMEVPLVLSSRLENFAVQIPIARNNDGREPTEAECRFLLQLLHAFAFLDDRQKSPFAFDPRSAPINHALRISEKLSSDDNGRFLHSKLVELVDKHCPEVLKHFREEDYLPSRSQTIFATMSRREAIDCLSSILRASINENCFDGGSANTESIFLQARSWLSDADLFPTVLASFLASPNKPLPSLTFPSLCRDPLIIFKCPVKVWRNKGLRHVAIAILSSLLESNTSIVLNSSPLANPAEEYIAARNAIVVRCLLMCVCGAECEIAVSHCSMTTSIIRSTINSHPGLFALLIKQGLPQQALDWLVEYVPETMNDSQDLVQMLSERSSLTHAERLVAADAVIRIAVVHGQNNEAEAAHMAYVALAQLVDSFFLVVGPIGVPVNALLPDESGLDITQISRKAAFRILKSTLRIRGRRTELRNECGMALQKLAILCKGESAVAGVAGAVAGRRKSLLKDIYDLVVKATSAMGSSLGAQSVAA